MFSAPLSFQPILCQSIFYCLEACVEFAVYRRNIMCALTVALKRIAPREPRQSLLTWFHRGATLLSATVMFWRPYYSIQFFNTSSCPTDSCRNEPIPLESAGVHRNGTGIHRNGQESTGMELEMTGMALEWTKMDILEPDLHKYTIFGNWSCDHRSYIALNAI